MSVDLSKYSTETLEIVLSVLEVLEEQKESHSLAASGGDNAETNNEV